MEKAIKMFRQLGLYIKTNTENDLLYTKETKYEKLSVFFHKDRKLFYVLKQNFIPKDIAHWEAQIKKGEESDWVLNSCKYGYWQVNFCYEIDMELLKAINQQCRALGWFE